MTGPVSERGLMKKLVRSRAGCRSPRPPISIRVRPIEMSKCPASSNTVQCGRPRSTGTSSVDVSHSGLVKPREAASIRASSPASVSIVVPYEPMSSYETPLGARSQPVRTLSAGRPYPDQLVDFFKAALMTGASHLAYDAVTWLSSMYTTILLITGGHAVAVQNHDVGSISVAPARFAAADSIRR